MTTPVIPRALVNAPPRLPARYGLFSAVRMIQPPGAHQLTGIEYMDVCELGTHPYPVTCIPGIPPEPKNADVKPELIQGSPFGIYAADACPPLGRSQEEARTLVDRRLELGEEHVAEELLWTGTLGNRPSLATNAEILFPGFTFELMDAVGVLEDWIVDTFGSLGVLHAPRWLTPRLHDLNLTERFPDRTMRDPLDNWWVLGAGYPGTPPNGQPDDGATWLFATGPITVRRSEIIRPADWDTGAFNTRENSTFLLAERIYVIDFPCPAAAIKTTHLRPGHTTPSPQTDLETTWEPVADDPMAIDVTVRPRT